MSRHHNMVNYKFFGYILSYPFAGAVKFIKKESVKALRRDGKETVLEALEPLEPCRETLRSSNVEGEEFFNSCFGTIRRQTAINEDVETEEEFFNFGYETDELEDLEDLEDLPGFGTHYDPIHDKGPEDFAFRLDRDLCSLFPAYVN